MLMILIANNKVLVIGKSVSGGYLIGNRPNQDQLQPKTDSGINLVFMQKEASKDHTGISPCAGPWSLVSLVSLGVRIYICVHTLGALGTWLIFGGTSRCTVRVDRSCKSSALNLGLLNNLQSFRNNADVWVPSHAYWIRTHCGIA